MDVVLKKNKTIKSLDSFSNFRKIGSEDLKSVRDLINSIDEDKAAFKQ